MRVITSHDFGKSYDKIVKAQYRGNLKTGYLKYGLWYNVVYKRDRNKIAIPVGANPTIAPNSGYEVALKNFYVKD